VPFGQYDHPNICDEELIMADHMILQKVDIYVGGYKNITKHLGKRYNFVYIDPPYNSRQYSRFYHVYETLVKWDMPELYGTAMKPAEENMSAYCSSKAPIAFADLIQSLDTKYIVVSYNNTYNSKSKSSQNKISLEQILEVLNAKGEKKDLSELFKDTTQKVPPAGAGECAAPKLLQYAYQNGLIPIAMAEFWWGDSPKQEIRRHGYYYPACKGKCEPILKHMLVGLQVDENPLQKEALRKKELEIVYEDEWLVVVNKPAGMLSVPGKSDSDSVYQQMIKRYPNATGPMIVHRLDMATSGLLLIAKNKEVHQNLQAQFKNRTIEKRYTAILDGCIKMDEGIIQLPIRPEPNDRPRQVVDHIYGKPAITRYQVIERKAEQTRISFYPLTGRTHQLRVHAAHPFGLNAPIIGDELYGIKADRLYLHAEYIAFQHPITNQKITIEKKAGF
jgi:tRNA pseudouridine32 synthase/23S rRNA pseudouridine746 synthase